VNDFRFKEKELSTFTMKDKLLSQRNLNDLLSRLKTRLNNKSKISYRNKQNNSKLKKIISKINKNQDNYNKLNIRKDNIYEK